MQLLPLLALALCWLQLFSRLWLIWSSDEQYGYGWLVPLLAAGLLWRRWKVRPGLGGLQDYGTTGLLEKLKLGKQKAEITRGGSEVSGQPVLRSSTATEGGWSVVRNPWSVVCGPWSALLLIALLLPFCLFEEVTPGGTTLPWIHALVLLGLSLGALRWWGGAPVLRHYWFPVFFLLTCIPWPGRVNDWVTQELMHWVARVSVEVVELFGIPAIAHDSTVDIATGSVGIDEACSGIRSLQTSIMLALLLGELFRLRPWKRILLLPFGILVALAANLGRTTLLTLSAAKQGFDKMHAWHGPAGLAVVGTVMGGLYLLARLWRERQEEPAKAESRPVLRSSTAEGGKQKAESKGQESEGGGQGSEVRDQRSEVGSQRAAVSGQKSMVLGPWSLVSGQKSEVSGQRSVVNGQWSVVSSQSPVVSSPDSPSSTPSAFSLQPSALPPAPSLSTLHSPLSTDDSALRSTLHAPRPTPLSPVFLILCCLWVPVTEGLTWAWYHWPGKGPAAAAPWSIQWPTNQVNYAETTLPPRTVEILRCAEHKNVSWTDPQGNRWGWVWLYWPPGQNLEPYVGGHNPERCMSAGWPFIKRVEPVAVNLGEFSMKFHHSLFRDGSRNMHVFRGTWEPFVPPQGQRLFPDRGLRARIRDILERRLIQGGITMEIALIGPATEQEANDTFQKGMAQLIVTYGATR